MPSLYTVEEPNHGQDIATWVKGRGGTASSKDSAITEQRHCHRTTSKAAEGGEAWGGRLIIKNQGSTPPSRAPQDTLFEQGDKPSMPSPRRLGLRYMFVRAQHALLFCRSGDSPPICLSEKKGPAMLGLGRRGCRGGQSGATNNTVGPLSGRSAWLF